MHRKDYGAIAIVMFGFAAATLTGFLRQAVLAHQLGAGRGMDIYLVAFALPEFVFIALPIVLASAFIPVFARCRQEFGEAAARRLGLEVAGGLLLFLLALTLSLSWGAPLYLTWLSPGFSPLERAQAVASMQRMLPALSLMGLATLGGAMLQVYRRFAPAAFATGIYNLVFVITLLVWPATQPWDRAAWGVTLGAAAAFVFQALSLWPARFLTSLRERLITRSKPASPRALRPTATFGAWVSVFRHFLTQAETEPSAAGFGQVLQLAGPLAIGYGIHHLSLFVDRAMATALGSGSAAALNYANHLALAVGQVSGLTVATVLFPKLAEQIAAGNTSQARASLAGALRLVWLIALPASVGLILLRQPLVQVLFEHGAFDRTATLAVSTPLAWYALGMLADALCQPFWRVVYAQRRMWTVAGVNGLQTGIRLLANVVLTFWLGYNGLALSAALGLMIQLVVLGWLVWRYLGAYWMEIGWHDLAWTTCATMILAGVLFIVSLRWHAIEPTSLLLISSLLGGLTYGVVILFSKYLRNFYHAINPNRLTEND